MSLPSIAIIDILGPGYDGNTLAKRGLGGSESAVARIAKQLIKLGFPVTVFNHCRWDDTEPGVYDGVPYVNLYDSNEHGQFPLLPPHDIMIATRTTTPFVPHEVTATFEHNNNLYPVEMFKVIRQEAKYKVLWAHDTFIYGDQITEELLVKGHFHRIFTLSDFHTIYVTNSSHGPKRMFEVMKPFIWQTRNGVDRYWDWVDIPAKDPNLFVYNSSVSKGMVELVKDIWPKVKTIIPDAKLTIIGGFYRLADKKPDAQEVQWHELKALPTNKDITFTGIITQKEIARILSKASFFLAPGAFPETFGISHLEALNYNTPIIGCRFGAMEETAIAGASYLIDYPIVPNSLFPFINKDDQVNKYVDTLVRAYQDRYLWQQKANYCNIVKDISGWDTVALQWKEHFSRLFNFPLSEEEKYRVKKINYRIHKVFNRRFSNPEDFMDDE